MSRRSASTITTVTSVVYMMRSGSGRQPQRAAAKSAYACAAPRSAVAAYPVSLFSIAASSAALTGGGVGKSISAMNMGRTSSG